MSHPSTQRQAEPPARVTVLIPAAGSGQRMGESLNKVLLPLAGVPLIRHTLERFQAHPRVDAIGLVARPADFPRLDDVFWDRARWSKLLPWIAGGPERQDSVRLGLEALAAAPPEWVLVHDGARPLCSASLIDRVLDALERHWAVVPTVPIHDTVRHRGERNEHAGEVVDRSVLFLTQTPQGFHWEVLYNSHVEAKAKGLRGTDDGQLVALAGASEPRSITWVLGERRNLKVTSPADLALAEWIFGQPGWGLDGS
jgi:2-C-methyl-D-erythritol 4-phosphate cytidylyltransferase